MNRIRMKREFVEFKHHEHDFCAQIVGCDLGECASCTFEQDYPCEGMKQEFVKTCEMDCQECRSQACEGVV